MSVAFPSERHEIEREQLQSLNVLLRQVGETNAFYRSILRQAGVADGVTSLEEFCASTLFTTKAVIAEDQQQHPPYGTNLTFPVEHYSRFNQTSATTGRPIRWLDTTESWQGLIDNWKHVFAAADVGPASRLYFAFSFGPFLGFWTAFEAASQLGCLCLPGGGLSSLGRLEAIRANQADVLLCTPTYAGRLAQVASDEGLDLSSFAVRKIIVAGEPGGSVPEIRRDLEHRWQGAAVFDHQRDAVARGLVDAADDDVVLIADMDEIPDPRGYGSALRLLKANPFVTNRLRHYCYWLNALRGDRGRWPSGVWARVGTLRQNPDVTISQVFSTYRNASAAVVGGWHFTWQGPLPRIEAKIHDMMERKYDTDAYREQLYAAYAAGRYCWRHGEPDLPLEIQAIDDTFPLPLQRDTRRWAHMIKGVD